MKSHYRNHDSIECNWGLGWWLHFNAIERGVGLDRK
jgi:hypothetical protein